MQCYHYRITFNILARAIEREKNPSSESPGDLLPPSTLYCKFGLCSATSRVLTVNMTRELYHLVVPQPQDLPKPSADAHQYFLTLFRIPSFPASIVAISTTGYGFPGSSRP